MFSSLQFSHLYLFFSSESENVPIFPSIILCARKHLFTPNYASKIRQGLVLGLFPCALSPNTLSPLVLVPSPLVSSPHMPSPHMPYPHATYPLMHTVGKAFFFTQNCMALSGLSCKKLLVGSGWAISLVLV